MLIPHKSMTNPASVWMWSSNFFKGINLKIDFPVKTTSNIVAIVVILKTNETTPAPK